MWWRSTFTTITLMNGFAINVTEKLVCGFFTERQRREIESVIVQFPKRGHAPDPAACTVSSRTTRYFA